MPHGRAGFRIFLLALAVWVAPAPAQAASVKAVQTNYVWMSTSTQVVGSPTFTAVNPSKSFVVCSGATPSSSASQRVTCELTGGGTTVTITSYEANASQWVQWYVAEFDGGVSVQRNVATLGAAVTQLDVGISAVDLTKSFLLTSERFNNVSQINDEQWTVRAQLTTTPANNIRFNRNTSGTAVEVAWQVVTMQGAFVQRASNSIAVSAFTNNPGIPIPITMANSFLVFSTMGNATAAGVESSYRVRGRINTSSQIIITRAGNPAINVQVHREVVQLDDGTVVQRNTASTAADTDVILDAPLSPAVDTTKSIPWISVSGGYPPPSANTADLDTTSFGAYFTGGGSNLRLDRAGSSQDAPASVDWQVITFFKCNPSSVSNVSYVAATATPGAPGTVTLRWFPTTSPVVILRKQGTFGAADVPSQGQAHVAGDFTPGGAEVRFSGSGTTFTDSSGLSNDTTYTYRVFAQNTVGAATPCYATGAGTEVNGRPVASGGNEQWAYMGTNGSVLGAPTSDDSGNVYIGSNAGRIISLSGATGIQSWDPVTTTLGVQGYPVWTSLSSGIAFVQSTGKFKTGSGTSVTSPALATNPVVGNRIIVLAWSYNAGGAPTLTASDNKGNTYTSDAQTNYANRQNVAVLSAPVAVTGASFTVTVTSAQTASQITAVAMEYSGLGAPDQSGVNTGTSASATVSTAGATSAADELVVSVLGVDLPGVVFTSIAPAGSYTDRVKELDNSGFSGGEGADKIVLATGVQSNTWTTSPAMTSWATAIATYYPSGAAQQRVFAGDQGGRVYAVNTATGTTGSPGWQVTPAGSTAIQAGVSIQIRAYSQATTDFNTAYPGAYDVVFAATSNASTTNNKVVALRSDTAATLWTFPLVAQNVDQIFGQPWVDYGRNRLYVTSCAGTSCTGAGAQSSLWVIDSLSGTLITSLALGEISAAPTQSYDGDTLWVGNRNGDIYAVNLVPATPALKWGGTQKLALGSTKALKGFVWEDYATPGRLYFSTGSGSTAAVRCFQDPGAGATPDPASACSGGWPNVSTGVAVKGATTVLLLDQLYVGSYDAVALNNGAIVPIDPAAGALGTAIPVGDGLKPVGDMSTVTGSELLIGTDEGKVFKISVP